MEVGMPVAYEAWGVQSEDRDGRQYNGMIGGIAIYYNPNIAPGTVEFRNANGELIGLIHNVKQIDTSGRQ
jgi:hypothetical protein